MLTHRLSEDLHSDIVASGILLSELLRVGDIIAVKKLTDDTFIACLEDRGIPVHCEKAVDKNNSFGASLVKLSRKLAGIKR